MVAIPRVLMIGWEYPPHNSGGLGVACEGLTQALAERGTEIFFTLPYHHSSPVSHMHMISCQHPNWEMTPDQPPFLAYAKTKTVFRATNMDADQLRVLPQSELEQRVEEYADAVVAQAASMSGDFDVVHAHDWMSVPAALKVQQQLKKPMMVHIHSTELDRIPNGSGSPYILGVEQTGMMQADAVIAVSEYTKRVIVSQFGIPESKVTVVHNGLTPVAAAPVRRPSFARRRPVIVFMGRLTAQKGPEYFLNLAEAVVKEVPEALFIVAGSGDMYHHLLLETAAKGLSASLLFAGFLRDQQREQLLNRADIFVMPSLSEPFGLVALEAAQRRTPVIVSKQSGVYETLPSALVIDFWDIQKMTRSIKELLENKGLYQKQVRQQLQQVSRQTWNRAAARVDSQYGRVMAQKIKYVFSA